MKDENSWKFRVYGKGMPLGELSHRVTQGDEAFSWGPFIQSSVSGGVCSRFL